MNGDNRGMSEQQDRAAGLEQRYVAEYADSEGLVEGLDPAADGGEQSTDQVKATAADTATEQEVDEMADEGP